MYVIKSLKRISSIALVAVFAISCTTTDKVKEKGTDMKKAGKDGVNATLNCTGESALTQLFINGTESNLTGLSCKVSRFGSGDNSGLIVAYKARSAVDTVQVQFHLFGVEDFQIKPAKYNVNTNLTDKFGKLYIESGNPKVIQEISVYKGIVEIIDYGMSSNVVCGAIELKDNKGNVIKGRFNETIGGGL
jgi:hypothetical protein